MTTIGFGDIVPGKLYVHSTVQCTELSTLKIYDRMQQAEACNVADKLYFCVNGHLHTGCSVNIVLFF